MDAKILVTIVGLVLITFLAVAGALAGSINYTALALSLVSLLGLMWGNPLNRKDNGGDEK